MLRVKDTALGKTWPVWRFVLRRSSLSSPHLTPLFLVDICEELNERFGIGFSTLQVETDPHACPLEPDELI
jgi:hypothetical protein